MPTECHSLSPRRGLALLPLLILGALALGAVAFIIAKGRKAADGPVAVIWDKTPCAQCAMHLGDPRYAAQFTTADGVTSFFDDPGCLMLALQELHRQGQSPTAIWFHGPDEGQWFRAEEVAFLPSDDTPMDYGFKAVASGTPGSLPLKAVTDRLTRP